MLRILWKILKSFQESRLGWKLKNRRACSAGLGRAGSPNNLGQESYTPVRRKKTQTCGEPGHSTGNPDPVARPWRPAAEETSTDLHLCPSCPQRGTLGAHCLAPCCLRPMQPGSAQPSLSGQIQVQSQPPPPLVTCWCPRPQTRPVAKGRTGSGHTLRGTEKVCISLDRILLAAPGWGWMLPVILGPICPHRLPG